MQESESWGMSVNSVKATATLGDIEPKQENVARRPVFNIKRELHAVRVQY